MAATRGGNPEPYRTRLTGRLTASLPARRTLTISRPVGAATWPALASRV